MTDRIAFIKFGGLAAGGTERWMQEMAAALPPLGYEVDFYFCDTAPYLGSDFVHPATDPTRKQFMEQSGVNLIEFHVGAKDVRDRLHIWRDTDFWSLFDGNQYDLVQVASAGPAEYPAPIFKCPVVEFIALSAGVNFSRNTEWSIHLSQWQRAEWYARGGIIERSSVIPIPAIVKRDVPDLRSELGIPKTAVVAGFHQRAQDEIFSPIPLSAFKAHEGEGRWFVIMGGGQQYRSQAAELGLTNVRFVDHSGDTDRVSGFLATLDVFAHGRRDGETFGTVFAEAMMLGRPCLSHWTPIANAQPETFGPGGDFARTPSEYESMLGRLMTDDAYREELGAFALLHAERRFGLESCAAALAATYAEVLAGTSSRRRVTEGADFNTFAYGEDPRGFLIAGDLEDRASPAFSVISRQPAHGAVGQFLDLIAAPAWEIAAMGDAACELLPVALCRGATATVDADPTSAAPIWETVWLNRWSPRLRYSPHPLASVLARESSPHVLIVSSPVSEEDLAGIGTWFQKTPDAVLLVHRELAARIGEIFTAARRPAGHQFRLGEWILLLGPSSQYARMHVRRARARSIHLAWRGQVMRTRRRLRRSRGERVALWDARRLARMTPSGTGIQRPRSC